MAARIRFDVVITQQKTVQYDEHAISRWIEGRLNNARNVFVRNVSRGAGGGREYPRGKRGLFHKASAPGEYPVTDSGRLANSIDYRMISPREGALFSEIDYAEYLTRGTRRMKKRKMLHEAVKESLEGVKLPPGLVLAKGK